MTALFRLTGKARSQAVAEAFGAALRANPDGRARVKFQGLGMIETVEYFLVGIGWNASYAGTQEALIVRRPEERYALDMIPYTRLHSIEPVMVKCLCGKEFTPVAFDQHMHLNNGQGGRHGFAGEQS